jgi:hypothetical protein
LGVEGVNGLLSLLRGLCQWWQAAETVRLVLGIENTEKIMRGGLGEIRLQGVQFFLEMAEIVSSLNMIPAGAFLQLPLSGMS